MNNTPIHRVRSFQPYGLSVAASKAVRHFYCANHDYDYYPEGWTAPGGRYFKEGYYDENGQHYDNMVCSGGTTMLKCEYCGNSMVYKWAEGDVPICDKCGAQFKIDITDKAQEINKNSGAAGRFVPMGGSPKTPLVAKIIIGVFLGGLIVPILVFIAMASYVFANHRGSDGLKFENSSVKNSVYVEEIGRTCYLDGQDWYDSKSECWFYFNDDVSPYQWQYWYEGISSDYGDYGWMEYDMGEDAWYIETGDGSWVHLPAEYDTSDLWHMTDEYTDAYD